MSEALIIDDNRSTADALLQMLELLGVNARTAYGSSAAMGLLTNFTPDDYLPDITMQAWTGSKCLASSAANPDSP
jgi:DNA-binding NtrC family response regulator